MKKINIKLFPLLFCSLLPSLTSIAEESFNNDLTLEPIIVTANPLERSNNKFLKPITTLDEKDLLSKAQSTIGETLSHEIGIRSTYFGPNSSRPVIRGLEGNQINILQNGIDNLDASAVSVDHNVAFDPLAVKKIEVIRGPAALLYGSKAVGGVVNILDNRIPDKQIEQKITGKTDIKYNSANNERSGSILIEGGFDKYSWHINSFKRLTNNIKIPDFANSKNLREQDSSLANIKNKLPNSQSENMGGTIGVSRFFDNGYFGVSYTNYDSNYGTVAEPDVTIDMKQDRFDLAGRYNFNDNLVLNKINYKLGFSDYNHIEFEGGSVGTIFKNRGYDSRIEVVHNKLGLFKGLIGFQTGQNDFSANGEEAYLAPSSTNSNSLFILEEIDSDDIIYQIGGRIDHQKIKTKTSSSFGEAKSRDDLTGSGSLGLVYNYDENYSIGISTTYTQRAPNAQELYANGNHVATGSFEIGNENLSTQKSYGIDLFLKKNSDNIDGEINLFYNNFNDFITLVSNGNNDLESGFPIYNYVNLPAKFYGAEIKAKFNIFDYSKHNLDLELKGDYVEARNSKTNEPLPRISPARLGLTAYYNYNNINFKFDTNYTFAANNVAENETKTAGYLMLDTSVEREFNFNKTKAIFYVKATNLLDKTARNHVSFIKDQAPLAGRSFMIGVRNKF